MAQNRELNAVIIDKIFKNNSYISATQILPKEVYFARSYEFDYLYDEGRDTDDMTDIECSEALSDLVDDIQKDYESRGYRVERDNQYSEQYIIAIKDGYEEIANYLDNIEN